MLWELPVHHLNLMFAKTCSLPIYVKELWKLLLWNLLQQYMWFLKMWHRHLIRKRKSLILLTLWCMLQLTHGLLNSRAGVTIIQVKMRWLKMVWFVSAGTPRSRTSTVTPSPSYSRTRQLRRQAIIVVGWMKGGRGATRRPVGTGVES